MTEKRIAEIFEQTGLAGIVRELKNDELTKALESTMIEIADEQNLPAGLDEAANNFAKDWYKRRFGSYPERCRGCYSHIQAAVMYGAEWMAALGIKTDCDFDSDTRDMNIQITKDLLESNGIYPPCKLIVQIRKKEE